jgi:hypothetical protein
MHITTLAFINCICLFGFLLLLVDLLLLSWFIPSSCDVPRKATPVFPSFSLTLTQIGHAKFFLKIGRTSNSLNPCLAKHICVGDTPNQMIGFAKLNQIILCT